MTSTQGLEGTSALITDYERRKGLPIVRALGRAGVRVVGLSSVPAPMCGFSKYSSAVYRCPDYTKEPAAFLDRLREVCERERIDVLYPIEEDSLELSLRHPEAWAPARAVLPTLDAFTVARDKWQTIQTAEKAGVPVPRTVCPENEEEVRELARGWQGDAVIKPRSGSGSRGLRFVTVGEDLVQAWSEVNGAHPRPLIQERVPVEGKGLGVFALMDAAHEPAAVFGHQRIREYPVTGGPSTLRRSYRDPLLIEQSIRLLREMRWTGLAMVEYKMDERSGRPVLMEVNPRFWGSLELAVLAGVNFPVLYHRMALGLPVEPVLDFREDVYCRWLLPGDILHFASSPDRFRLDPGFFQFRQPNLGYDIISSDDPWPMAGVLLEALRKLRHGR